MNSDEKLCEAFKSIIEELDKSINNHQEIEAVEQENIRLRERKRELITKLNRPTSVVSSLVLIKDLLSRQKTINQFRLESKQKSLERFKERSREADAEISMLKHKLIDDDDNPLTLPYHFVLDKIMELKEKTAKRRLVIKELIDEQLKLEERNHFDESEDIRFIETLKTVLQEQRQLIEKLKGATLRP